MKGGHKSSGTSGFPCTQAKQVLTAGGQFANKDAQVLVVGRNARPPGAGVHENGMGTALSTCAIMIIV